MSPTKGKVVSIKSKPKKVSANTLAGIPLMPANEIKVQRLSLLLWGLASCGKTTLACTAPGRKLIINLDPDGPQSVSTRDDVEVIDLSRMQTEDVLKVLESSRNPLGLDRFLDERRDIETVILDSVTSVAYRGLESAVSRGLGKGNRFTPTMQQPGLSAYGGRNATVVTILMGLLRVTGRHGCHFIATAHEDNPITDEKGITLFISIMLGGKLVNHVSPQLSDIWWMTDVNKKRQLAIRARQMRKPMKSRLFRQDGSEVFEYKTNDETLLTDIWNTYIKSGGVKLKTEDFS